MTREKKQWNLNWEATNPHNPSAPKFSPFICKFSTPVTKKKPRKMQLRQCPFSQWKRKSRQTHFFSQPLDCLSMRVTRRKETCSKYFLNDVQLVQAGIVRTTYLAHNLKKNRMQGKTKMGTSFQTQTSNWDITLTEPSCKMFLKFVWTCLKRVNRKKNENWVQHQESKFWRCSLGAALRKEKRTMTTTRGWGFFPLTRLRNKKLKRSDKKEKSSL